MRKKLLLTAMLAMTLTVGACKGADSSSNPGGSNNPGGSTPNNPGTSVSVIDEYQIRLPSVPGVSIISNKTKAKAGEAISLTVTVNSGYSLKSIMMNKTALIGISDVYTFTMPDQDAVITVSLSVTGDITIGGDLAFKLEAEGDIFVARNITVSSKANLYYTVKGQSGDSTELRINDIDRTKSFANIDVSTLTGYRGFRLDGGAKYDFYYDPAEIKPCYIQRVELTRLPDSADSLATLFAGKVGSEPSVYPAEVNKVTYINTLSAEEYTWDLYQDSSLAVVKDRKSLTPTEKAVVYKEIDWNNDLYTVVDSYLEGKNDTTRKDDLTAFSGKYSIVDAIETGHSKYQRTKEVAAFDAQWYSHDTTSIDFDIHYGYRTGFDMTWNDYLKQYSRVITPIGEIGSDFSINIASHKVEVNDDSSTKTYKKYIIDLNFNKAGALKSGTYQEIHFGTDAYNFDTLAFKPGGETLGVTYKEMQFEYSYGAAKVGKPTFNTAPYFTTELDIKIKNVLVEGTTATLDLGSYFEGNVVMHSLPETALDTWQYGPISTTNSKVIGPRISVFDYMAHDIGTATIVFGNNTTNHLTRTIDFTVASSLDVRSFYTERLNYGDTGVDSTSVEIYSGTTRKVYCKPSPNGAPKSYTPVSADTSLLNVSVDENYLLVLDATAANVTAKTTVKVTINSNYYESGKTPTQISIYIMPKALTASDLIGTWQQAGGTATVTFTNTVSSKNATMKTGTIVVKGKTIPFRYSYDSNQNKLVGIADDEYFDIYLIYDISTGRIGVACDWWDHFEDQYELYLGVIYEDDEGFIEIASYDYFTKQ